MGIAAVLAAGGKLMTGWRGKGGEVLWDGASVREYTYTVLIGASAEYWPSGNKSGPSGCGVRYGVAAVHSPQSDDVDQGLHRRVLDRGEDRVHAMHADFACRVLVARCAAGCWLLAAGLTRHFRSRCRLVLIRDCPDSCPAIQ